MTQPDNRYREYLFSRYKTFAFFLGLTWFFMGSVMHVPLVMCIIDGEPLQHILSFVLPGSTAVIAGLVTMRRVKNLNRVTLTFQEGAMVVTLAWASAFLIGSFPFWLGMEMPFHVSFFESTSGWTTTGMTMVDPDSTPRSFLLFRSLSEFVGGAGLVILTLSAAAGPIGSSLSAAEGRSEYLVPNVRRSAKLVLTIYALYLSVTIIALRLAGMQPFDALNHALVAVSTGGFSTRSESVGYWDNPVIEVVLIVVMFAAAINFATMYSLFTGKGRSFYKSGEVRVFLFLLSSSIILLTLFVTPQFFLGNWEPLRHATFAAVSAITGTGLSTASYSEWGGFGYLIFIVLMIVGGGTGSTSAGIKQFRVYAIYRALVWELKKMFLPRGASRQPDLWQGAGRRFLSTETITQITLFVLLYQALLVIGTSCFLAYGYSFKDSLFEFTSALGNTGLSSGITNPDLPAPLIWLECLAMFFGRLEVYTVIVGLVKLFGDGSFLCQNTLQGKLQRR